MPRTLLLHTPLDAELLKFASLRGTEALSTVSTFELDAVSPSPDIDARTLLGKSVTVEIQTQAHQSRYFNALVTELVYLGPDSGAELRYRYRARLRSWLHLADKTSDHKIFQNKSVPEIVKEVLREYASPFELNLNLHSAPVMTSWKTPSAPIGKIRTGTSR